MTSISRATSPSPWWSSTLFGNAATPVVNIGVDVVDIARFARVVERSPRLVQRVFTEREVEQSGGTTLRASSLAARWAAKEAVAKVLVDNRGLSWHDCEVVAAGRGQPTLQMRGTVLQAGLALGIDSWLLSLSHDGGMAVAFVVAQRTMT